MTPLRTAFALGLAFALATGAATATEIGVVAATNTQIDGTPPASATRTLAVSDRLNLNERVNSSASGNGQFLFDDQTTLTIAPNTDIVLDEYVYDPARDAGKIAMSFNKGVMRFIGGRISKSADATVTTPVATIGIRGGIAIIEMLTPDKLQVIHVAGEYSRITRGDKVLTLTRTNAVATVERGGAPTYQGVATADQIAVIFGALQGGGGGGARGNNVIRTAQDGRELAGIGRDATDTQQAPTATDGSQPENIEQLDSNFDLSGVDQGLQSLRFQNDGFIRDNAENVGTVDVGGEGLVRGQLIWTNTADLDLHLVLPDGAGEVSFSNETIVFNEGGAVAALDADNLGNFANGGGNNRVENISVTGDAIPAGRYTFFVENFSDNGNALTPFTLTVTGDGERTLTTQTGTLGPDEISTPLPIDSAGGVFTAPGS